MITEAMLRELQRGKREMGKIIKAQDTAMTRAWANAWDDVLDELSKVLRDMAREGVTRTRMLKTQRLINVLRSIDRSLSTLVGNAVTDATTRMALVVAASERAQRAAIGSVVPDDAFTRVDDAQLRAIVARASGNVVANAASLTDEAMLSINRTLATGFAQGIGAPAAARLMRTAVHDAFNVPLSRALLITRTETIDAFRRTAEETHRANDDVVKGWVWVAELSTRTCPSCVGMHGTEHPNSEDGPLDHHAGRCTRMPIVKSFRELGIDVDTPKPPLKDADEWFSSLKPGEQRELLGPARYDAWKRGAFDRGQWARRRENKGWRDSYVPAPAPQAS